MALEDGLGSAAQGAAMGAQVGGPVGALIGGGVGLLGGILGGSSARKAAAAKAAALKAAGQAAAQDVRFRPVGTTSAFGTTNYQYDPATGQMISGGYELSPELAAMQGGLLGQAGGAGMDFTGQGLQGAQSLFNLGQSYLAESPQQAAQNYMANQQALLAPSREQARAGLTQNLFNTGRGGVAVAQGTGMGAANPELQALMNAQAQQDLKLASDAQTQGMRQTEFGASLFGLGSQAATAGYSPMQSALKGALGIEQMGQIPFNTAMDLSGRQQSANQLAADYMFQGAGGAARAMESANAYNPLATALTGASKNAQLMNSIGSLFSSPTPQVDTSVVGYTGPDRGLWF